jgi:branched-chain amino acid transport system permease protein
MRDLRFPAMLVVGGAALILPAFFVSAYRLGVLALVATYAIASLAQNLLSGYADVPSLGNVTFFGVSAYTAGSLVSLGHVPLALAAIVAILAAGGLGFVIGLPALRISGMHLAIVTLVLVFAGQEVMSQWDQHHNPSGVEVTSPDWLLQERGFYAAAVVLAVIAYLAVWNILRSRSGRAIKALSENPLAAAAVGIDPTRYRLQVFVVSGMLTGAAGIVFLYSTAHVNPATFSLDLSLAFLTMMILGGTSSLGGSLLGAVIIGLLPQLLDTFPAQLGNLRVQDLGPAIYALLLLLTLRFFPEGVWNAIVTRRVLRREPT